MSEQKQWKGVLIPYYEDLEVETACHTALNDCGIVFNEGEYTSAIDQVEEKLYDQFIVVKDSLYKIVKQDISYQDIFEGSSNRDGSIDFVVSFYNGGCSLGEALEYVIDKVKGE